MATDKKEATPNLYQKLLLIMAEVGKIEKTGKNTAQGYSFTEYSEVLSELRPVLYKFGVMIVPETIDRSVERYVKTVQSGNYPAKEQSTFHVKVSSRYTLINADNPDERMVCEWNAGEALDTSDKATNKATTASHKTFLMKLFNISDKEDPDAYSPDSTGSRGLQTYNRDDFQPEPSIDISESEGITPEVIAKLEGQVKLKGISTKPKIAQVLDGIAKAKYDTESIKDISLAQGREVYATIRDTDPTALKMLIEAD